MSSGADRRAPSSAPARGAPRTASLIAAGSQVLAEATAAEVSRALAGAGVRTILLKGPSFARWLYLADEPRTTLDVDLLVAPHDIAPAQAILARIGFEPLPTNDPDHASWTHAFAWVRGAAGVDLHVTLPGVGVDRAAAWDLLSRDTDGIAVGGIDVEVLAPAARALHVALHAGQHGRGGGQPPADLERALEVVDDELWETSASRGRRRGAA